MHFQNESIPGLMYGISALLLILSASICCTMPDTKDQVLQDTYEQTMPEVSYSAKTNEISCNVETEGKE
mgnify:FL=1